MPPKTVKKNLSKKKKIGLLKKDEPSGEQKGLELQQQQQQQQLQLQRLQQQQQQQQQLQQQPQINQWFQKLNQSKYFAGVIMILMNMGSRFISLELSERHESILGHPMVRRLMLFTVFFTATRDVWISLGLTACFVILVTGIFHDESRFCMIPERYRKGKKVVTKSDIEKVRALLPGVTIKE